MLINFCHSVLTPKVKCSCLSNEEYDVTNLVSSNFSKYTRGFLAYVVVRPPVSVDFEFLCGVNLSHIVIWPQVGSQKSTGFEIFSKQDNTNSDQRLGSVVLQDSERGVVFHLPDSGLGGSAVPAGFVRKAFTSRVGSLRNVKSLTVRIFKTSSSVPALGRVEVWGWINHSTPMSVRSKVLKLWNSRNGEIVHKKCGENHVPDVKKGHQSHSLLSPDSKPKEKTRSVSCIPDDFLDSLTYDVMTLPMILPCGKVVDKTTLDKHKQCEAKWGRSPSDPFTGILFTKDCHPLLATSLKARIDKFLVDNADQEEVRYLPRTLGGWHHSQKPSVEVSQAHSSGQQSLKLRDSSKREAVDVEGTEKRRKVGPSTLAELTTEDDDSLDCALKRVLSGLPSFVSPTPPKSQVLAECGACSGTRVLFTLPCRHCMCRKCLTEYTSGNNLSCRLCGRHFTSSDPTRYHS